MRHVKFYHLLVVVLVASVSQLAKATTLDVSTNTASNWSITGAGATGATAEQYGTTVSLSTNAPDTGGTYITGGNPADFDGFWVATEQFYLPADATGVSFNFSGLASDDRTVLELNGNILGDYFLGNNTYTSVLTGPGYMSFSDGTPPPETDYTFTGITSGDITTAADFVFGGENTITLVVNNADVAGDPDNHLYNLTVPYVNSGDQTYGALTTATVSYVETAVPLAPAAWLGLILLGGVAAFAAARSRHRFA
jgi:hypothetical protein